MPGRKKIPPQLKQIRGTYQPCRDELPVKCENSLEKLPKPPDYLKGEGLIYYNEQGAQYLRLGVLNAYCLPLFLTVCMYISLISEYGRKLSECSDIDKVIRYQRLFNEAEKNLRLTMAELGLTPSTWHRVAKDLKKQPSDFESKFLIKK